jgi:hypothetical protein
MRVALRPSLRLFAFVPTIIAIGAVVFDLALVDFFGPFRLAAVSLLVYVAVGLLLVLRVPRQSVGWLLLAAGTFFQLSFAAPAYAWAAFIRWPGVLPLGEVALLIGFAWIPALGCLFLAIMLFPTGRPPSRRWNLPAALVVLVTAWVLVGALFAVRDIFVAQSFTGGQSTASFAVRNPIVLDGTLATWIGYAYSTPQSLLVYLIPVAAVLARFRTATGNERLQLKWFAYASSIAMLFFLVAGTLPLFPNYPELASVMAVVVMDLIPISVAIAILRFRLYDIDLLIERTLVYGATTGAIALTFFTGVVVLPALLRPLLVGGSDVAVAVSTLVCFALFQPLRSRVQDAVDRRFYRSRYDAARTLDAFSVRLRDEVDLDSVRDELLDAVGTTLSPVHASVWLRQRAR